MTTQREQLQNEWPYETVIPEDGEPLDDLLTAIATQQSESVNDIDFIYNQRFLQTATDRELELLAEEVSVFRRSGETDSSLRQRALINKVETQSQGTFKDIEKVLESIFDDITNVRIVSSDDSPTVVISVPQTQLDSLPITVEEFEDEIESALPVSDPVEVVSRDTFIFGETGSQGLGGELV